MGAFSFFATAELHARGRTDAQIRAAVRAGKIEPVVRGWYCTRAADRGAVRAMRLGGRLSCVSSLALLGGWDPPESGLHIGFPSHASGRRLAQAGEVDDVVAHWHAKDSATGSRFAVTPIEQAIGDLLVCQPPAFVVATLDSLLHKRVIQRNRVGALVLQGPVRMRHLADALHPDSGSGIESIVRFGLRAAGIRARIQVIVRGA